MFKEVKFPGSYSGLAAYEGVCDNPEIVMCCIHGIGEYFGRYERMSSFMKEYGIAMVGMDLRGHGKTEGRWGHCAPRNDVLSDIDSMIEYAKNRFPDIPLILYGHSMGGNIGLDYRYRGRLNGVPDAYVISAPWVKLVKPVTGALYSFVKILSKVAPQFTISSAVDEKVLGNPVSVGSYHDNPMVHNKISALTAIDGFSIGNAIYDGTWEKRGEGYKKPLLLMHGDADRICDVEGSRKVAEHEGDICTYIEWENFYHEIHNGGPDSTGEEVIRCMAEWIVNFKK